MAELLEAPQCLPPRPLRNPTGLRLPEGTCDSHFHVFVPDAPLASPRSYTPCMETLAGWRALAESFGIARGVLVQPSVYGTVNNVLLAALAAEPERLRGIVVIPATTREAELQRLDDLGVRGVRINLRNKAGIGLDALETLAPRLSALGWHVQFQVDAVAIATVAALAARHGIAGVIDHLAFMPLDPPGEALGALLRAMDGGRIYTKISAPYRLADSAGHDGYRSVVGRLANSHPERLLWGSDWPHTELFTTVPEEDDLVALALEALPEATHGRVFAENAEALYWSH